jgi:hypothetical protein
MFRIISVLLWLVVPAYAQEQSASEQALSQKLLQEIGVGLQCSGSLITVTKQLAEAKAKVKELEDKYEKK